MNQKPGGLQVLVRCRPLLPFEIATNRKSIISINNENPIVRINNPKARQSSTDFAFDFAYNEEITQEKIYASAVYPMIESVLEGNNATIFSYGYTAVGKSYTIQGNPSHLGLLPRSFEHIFYAIEQSPMDIFLLSVSFFEIYNDQVFDLLNNSPNNAVRVKESKQGVFYPSNLASIHVHSVQEMKDILAKGKSKLHGIRTMMNNASSVSHLVYNIRIERAKQDSDGNMQYIVGRLKVVDLAGYEKLSRTSVAGDNMKWAKSINKSLFALETVISSLKNGSSVQVPYRNSTLTKVLCEGLGGNGKTLMIANISPANSSYSDTLNTLRIATLAKGIHNIPRIEKVPKDLLIKHYIEDIRNKIDRIEIKEEIKSENSYKEMQIREIEKPLIDKEWSENEQIKEIKILHIRESKRKLISGPQVVDKDMRQMLNSKQAERENKKIEALKVKTEDINFNDRRLDELYLNYKATTEEARNLQNEFQIVSNEWQEEVQRLYNRPEVDEVLIPRR
jgi:kinesin family member 17